LRRQRITVARMIEISAESAVTTHTERNADAHSHTRNIQNPDPPVRNFHILIIQQLSVIVL
jgi:hypothetical protein